jgi:excisionase family DNA binding protein
MGSAAHIDSPFLSVEQLADRYGVSPATVHQWLYKRKGPRSHKFGRYRRFHLEDVLEWEAAHAEDPDAGATSRPMTPRP